MEKKFDDWNKEKKRVDLQSPRLYMARQMWWASLGVNVGSEQDGTGVGYQRPVLIVKGISTETCFVVPLTTSSKKHRYRVRIGTIDEREASAVISQLRLIDTKRLVNKIGFLDTVKFQEIRKAVRKLF